MSAGIRNRSSRYGIATLVPLNAVNVPTPASVSSCEMPSGAPDAQAAKITNASDRNRLPLGTL